MNGKIKVNSKLTCTKNKIKIKHGTFDDDLVFNSAFYAVVLIQLSYNMQTYL